MAVGFDPLGTPVSGINSVYREYTKDGNAGAQGDLASLESGVLSAASAGDFVCGVLTAAEDASATGVQVNITPFLEGVMDNDNTGTTFASTHVGSRFDIIGGTGAQVIDTSSVDNTGGNPSGTLVCTQFNFSRPPYAGDASIGLFAIVDHQLWGGR